MTYYPLLKEKKGGVIFMLHVYAVLYHLSVSPGMCEDFFLQPGWTLDLCVRVFLVAQLCLTLCNPMDCSVPGSFSPWNSPGKNTAMGCHFLPQGIFPTERSNPGLLHCRQIL